jgi:hypothetical protein
MTATSEQPSAAGVAAGIADADGVGASAKAQATTVEHEVRSAIEFELS